MLSDLVNFTESLLYNVGKYIIFEKMKHCASRTAPESLGVISPFCLKK